MSLRVANTSNNGAEFNLQAPPKSKSVNTIIGRVSQRVAHEAIRTVGKTKSPEFAKKLISFEPKDDSVLNNFTQTEKDFALNNTPVAKPSSPRINSWPNSQIIKEAKKASQNQTESQIFSMESTDYMREAHKKFAERRTLSESNINSSSLAVSSKPGIGRNKSITFTKTIKNLQPFIHLQSKEKEGLDQQPQTKLFPTLNRKKQEDLTLLSTSNDNQLTDLMSLLTLNEKKQEDLSKYVKLCSQIRKKFIEPNSNIRKKQPDLSPLVYDFILHNLDLIKLELDRLLKQEEIHDQSFKRIKEQYQDLTKTIADSDLLEIEQLAMEIENCLSVVQQSHEKLGNYLKSFGFFNAEIILTDLKGVEFSRIPYIEADFEFVYDFFQSYFSRILEKHFYYFSSFLIEIIEFKTIFFQ